MLIGLCGKKHSGKSTIANYLHKEHGFVVGSFSKPICLMEETFLRYQGMPEDRIQHLVYGEGRDVEIVPELGWQTSRYFQQTIGTDWGRVLMHESIWLKAFTSTDILENENIVIENVRFLNESFMVRNQGGYVIKIIRPNGDEDLHVSEQEIDKIEEDFRLVNDSKIESIVERIKWFISDKATSFRRNTRGNVIK